MFRRSLNENKAGGRLKHVILLLFAIVLPFGFILLGIYYLYSKKSGQKETD